MTRKLFRFILPAALLTVTALAQAGTPAAANPAAPSTSASARIGIINIQNAIVMTNEGRRDFEALQKKFEPTQSTLNNLNQEIENLKKQLQTQGDKLNEQSRADMVKNIETKQKSLQRQAEDAQADFQAQQNEIANRIGGKLLEVLDKYAKQGGYSVILDVSGQQSPVLWAAQTSDVTQDIVNTYNSQSSVAAPVSAPGGAAKPAGTATRPPAPKPPAPKP
ncbi:MAG: OmpH family outer membrane protein [Acidobacteriia bacterium]|nr:OmpH family outer membrane protein [Terriglobia bacterium]